MTTPLTLNQFNEKHSAKFAKQKLSKADRLKRYDDYLMGIKNFQKKPKKTKAGKTTQPKTRVRKRDVSLKVSQAVQSYLASVCDPFSHDSCVKIPCLVPDVIPTKAFQHREIFTINPVSTTGNGYQFSLMAQGDVTRFKAVNYNIIAATGNFTASNIVFGGYPQTAMKGYQQIQALYQNLRTVSCGIIVRYTGPPISASGLIGAAILPPGFMPNFGQPNRQMSFNDFTTLETAKVGPAIDGIEIVGVPYILDASFRRTTSIPNSVNGSTLVNECWDLGNSNPGPAENEGWLDYSMNIQPLVYTQQRQFEYNDSVDDPAYPRLFVVGTELPQTASFEVEIVYNFEAHLRLQTNEFGESNLRNEKPAIAKDGNELGAATTALKTLTDSVGVVSTRKDGGISKVVKNPNFGSIFKNIVSSVPSVASSIFKNIDHTSFLSNVASVLGPIAEGALPILAALV